MFCPSCGTQNFDSAVTCVRCGLNFQTGAHNPPGGPQAWGAPPGAPQATPQAAPQGWGAPPAAQDYGPPPQAWGPAPGGGAQGWGAPPGYAPVYAPQYAMAPAYNAGLGEPGPIGTTRNPMLVLVLSFFCFYSLYIAFVMLYELQAYTRDDDFKPWKILIPFYNLYFWYSEVPDQVTKAKRMAGCLNPYATGFYQHANVALYSLAKDLNEIWNPHGAH